MSRWEKLIADVLSKNPSLRFSDLQKALLNIGYNMEQPRGGSSHYTFRKKGCVPITLPKKKQPMDKVYVTLVAEAVQDCLSEGDE